MVEKVDMRLTCSIAHEKTGSEGEAKGRAPRLLAELGEVLHL